MSEHKLLASVIIALIDHRDQYMKSIQSFRDQTLENESYEIIVACIETAPELDEITTAYPDVRIVFCDHYQDHEMYNTGVENAYGQYIYLTECHCFAQPECVANAIEAAKTQNVDCINSNSTGANANRFAEMEQTLFEIDVERWKASPRSKLSLRGFLIERVSWDEVGGFPTEYGHFAELMIGQRLQQAGKTFGYADLSFVAHYNQPSPKTLIAELIHYGFHECHSNHYFPPNDPDYLCEEWQWYRDKPEEVSSITQKHQRRLRWLYAVLMISPRSTPWFFSYYRELWETSIRIGRLKYLSEMAKPDPLFIPKHPAAA